MTSQEVPWWQMGIGNFSQQEYGYAFLVFAALVSLFKIVQWLILRYIGSITHSTETEIDDAIVEVVKTIRPPFYIFISFYLALQYLNVTDRAQYLVRIILVSWVVYQVIRSIQIFIDVIVKKKLEVSAGESEIVIQLANNLTRVVLWALGILFVLQNLGVEVTSLIAGLGIGGVAIALAAQSVLGDLFSALSIYFDKPFVKGDFIIFGDYMGSVQKVGMKTTRIKSLSGEEIIVSNSELTSSKLRNYGRMKERRVVFGLDLTYGTSVEQLQKTVGWVKEIIARQDKVRFDRVHFKSLGEYSLGFEVVYYVLDKDYGLYMDIQQAILLQIKKKLDDEGVEMAFPTQTIYAKQSQG